MSEQQNLIDQYLSGQLDAEQKTAFEKRLASEADLAAALEETQRVQYSVIIAGRRDLKAKMEAWEEDLEKPKVEKKFLRPWMLVAATFALVIWSTYSLGWWPKMQQEPTAFELHFQVYRSPIQIRAQEAQEANLFAKAIQFYQAKDYSQTIAYLKKIDSAQSSQPAYLIQFYLGMAQLAQPVPAAKEAIAALEFVCQSENNYRQQATWYQGLAYVYLGMTSEASDNFKQLIFWNDFKAAEAADLLLQLNR